MMRIYVKDGKKVIDFDGTLIFSNNDYGISVETVKEGEEDPKVIIINAHIIGNHKSKWVEKIKNCIRLYKFMSAKQPQ